MFCYKQKIWPICTFLEMIRCTKMQMLLLFMLKFTAI